MKKCLFHTSNKKANLLQLLSHSQSPYWISFFQKKNSVSHYSVFTISMFKKKCRHTKHIHPFHFWHKFHFSSLRDFWVIRNVMIVSFSFYEKKNYFREWNGKPSFFHRAIQFLNHQHHLNEQFMKSWIIMKKKSWNFVELMIELTAMKKAWMWFWQSKNINLL